MPQCVTFDYFGVDCEKQTRVEGNSAWGRRVALGPADKPGVPTF